MSLLLTKSLPRRTVLRGLGATVALPLLDAMLPAFSLRGRAAGPPVLEPMHTHPNCADRNRGISTCGEAGCAPDLGNLLLDARARTFSMS